MKYLTSANANCKLTISGITSEIGGFATENMVYVEPIFEKRIPIKYDADGYKWAFEKYYKNMVALCDDTEPTFYADQYLKPLTAEQIEAISAECRKALDEHGYWMQVESPNEPKPRAISPVIKIYYLARKFPWGDPT